MVEGGFGGLCENGHDVPLGARFCPACGSVAHAPSGPLAGGPAPDHPAGHFPSGPVPPGPGQPYWSPLGPWNPPVPGYGFGPQAQPGSYPPPGPYPTSSVRSYPGALPIGYGGPPMGYAPPTGYGAPPGYWPYAPPRPGANGMAIASMVLGILWIWWIGSILAVIFGHISLHQIRRTNQTGRGMAIAGLVLGYLGVAVVVILILAAIASSGA